jgi:hypothetical protein
MRARWLALLVAACGSSSPCPATPPANGAACTHGPGFLGCEYGGDSHTDCTTFAACDMQLGASSPAWDVSTPTATCGTLAASCPASFGAMEGAACAVAQPACDYDDGVCACLLCEAPGGTSGYWHCRAWNDVPAGCPVPRARLGSPCDHDGLTCDYAQCCAGPAIGYRMRCTDGYWQSYVDTGCACAEPTCP